jgi:hypothetical protein
VAVSELEIENGIKEQIKSDIDSLLSDDSPRRGLLRMKPAPDSDSKPCRITEVSFFADGDSRRLLIAGEEADVRIETSLATAEVQVYAG